MLDADFLRVEARILQDVQQLRVLREDAFNLLERLVAVTYLNGAFISADLCTRQLPLLPAPRGALSRVEVASAIEEAIAS